MSDETREVGRPSKYNEIIQAMAEDYALNHKELADDLIPSAAGLCCYLQVARSTIYKWRDEHPLFSDTLKQIEDRQERILLNGGLSGAMNSTISKLILTNHGYSDKIDHRSGDGSMSPAGKTLDDFYRDSDVSTESKP